MTKRNAYFARRYGPVARREPPREQLIRILIELDGQHACVYCGFTSKAASLTIDHIVPRSRLKEFGITKDTPNNKVLACETCNYNKHDMTPKEVGYTFQPWVRRRKWLEKLYISHSILPQTPNGVKCPAYK